MSERFPTLYMINRDQNISKSEATHKNENLLIFYIGIRRQ